jgi:hypothetical protein
MACGAFCIKFYDGAREDIVIIDDFMPLVNCEFIFTRSPDEKEIWPQILEKAYAKKYGSYSNIEGGLVNDTLAELTNGIPEKMSRKKN